MENTSKALIVAGSILLAILLVSLGMYIYNISNQGDLSGNTALQIIKNKLQLLARVEVYFIQSVIVFIIFSNQFCSSVTTTCSLAVST